MRTYGRVIERMCGSFEALMYDQIRCRGQETLIHPIELRFILTIRVKNVLKIVLKYKSGTDLLRIYRVYV